LSFSFVQYFGHKHVEDWLVDLLSFYE
jgi:hypothetical protein